VVKIVDQDLRTDAVMERQTLIWCRHWETSIEQCRHGSARVGKRGGSSVGTKTN